MADTAFLEVRINGKLQWDLWDPGAQVTTTPDRYAAYFGVKINELDVLEAFSEGASGHAMHELGSTMMGFRFVTQKVQERVYIT